MKKLTVRYIRYVLALLALMLFAGVSSAVAAPATDHQVVRADVNFTRRHPLRSPDTYTHLRQPQHRAAVVKAAGRLWKNHNASW